MALVITLLFSVFCVAAQYILITCLTRRQKDADVTDAEMPADVPAAASEQGIRPPDQHLRSPIHQTAEV